MKMAVNSITRKRRGVFYSPLEVADLLATWAVRDASERILEPSFGGCDFLSALERRLFALGSFEPWNEIFGCDVDAKAFKQHLTRVLPKSHKRRHFVKADFLTLKPTDFAVKKFSVVIGNPPYVSHHNMFKVQRLSREYVESEGEFRLSRMSSLWAYFIFHSLRFLVDGGRMAWLLPGSVLHADYAKKLLHEVSRHFERTIVVSIQQRLFLSDGTSEATHILLCESYSSNEAPVVEVVGAKNIKECSRLLRDWNGSTWRGVSLNGRAQRALTPERTLKKFNSLSKSEHAVRLGDIADLSIGIVTGANKFFVINEDISRQQNLPKRTLQPILAKFAVAQGLSLTSTDFRVARSKGIRCLLVDGNRSDCQSAVETYFARFPESERLRNVTFGKRPDWRLPNDGRIPNAFLPYMHNTGPRLVLNKYRVNSTNTIHRVYFGRGVSQGRRKLVAISMVSTFSQISAEIEGRSYGGGILKHEIGEASKIQLLLPNGASKTLINRTFDKIDQLLRQGKANRATNVADAFLTAQMPKLLSISSLKALHLCLKHLREYRKPRSKKT